MLGFVAIAEDMFLLLLGERWMPTVPYFEILALSGLFYPLAVVSYNVLKARSDGRVILRLEIVKRVIMTAVLGVTIPLGVEAVAWGMTAMAAVEFLLNTATALRYLSCSMFAVVRAVVPSLLLAVAMFVAVSGSLTLFASCHVALRLLTTIAIGAISYLMLALLFRLRALSESISILRGVLSRSE
jgi:O-antigen/teichoic acid export membrane protein